MVRRDKVIRPGHAMSKGHSQAYSDHLLTFMYVVFAFKKLHLSFIARRLLGMNSLLVTRQN